jgi:hypothetical protein
MNNTQRNRVKNTSNHHQVAQKTNYFFRNFVNQDFTPNTKLLNQKYQKRK